MFNNKSYMVQSCADSHLVGRCRHPLETSCHTVNDIWRNLRMLRCIWKKWPVPGGRGLENAAELLELLSCRGCQYLPPK